MQICTLASSSSGNCTLVSHGDTHILIDAGISMRRTASALRTLGIDPGRLAGILVTHEHKDHIAGIGMMNKYWHTGVLAPHKVCVGVCSALPGSERYMSELPEGGAELGCMTVEFFPTPHDASASVGYRISAGGRTFVLATDTGCITDDMVRGAAGADTVLIEANHDLTMLRYGPYPSFLKQRIMSDRGHLSNDMAGRFAVSLASSGVRRVILGHLSKENNTPRLAGGAVAGSLKDAGADVGGDVELYIAPRDCVGEFFEV